MWPRETGTICPFGVFPPVLDSFLVQFEANPCDEANCGLVTFSLVLQTFWAVLCSSTPQMELSALQKHYVLRENVQL